MVCGLVKAPLLVSRASLKDDLHSVIECRPQMSQHTGLTGGGGGEMNTNWGSPSERHPARGQRYLIISFFFSFPLKRVGRKTNIKLQANEAFYFRRSFPCVGRFLKSHLKSRFKWLQKTIVAGGNGRASSSHLFPINANVTFCKTNPSLRCVRPFIHFFAPLILIWKCVWVFFLFSRNTQARLNRRRTQIWNWNLIKYSGWRCAVSSC